MSEQEWKINERKRRAELGWPECPACKAFCFDEPFNPDCQTCEGTGYVCPTCLGAGWIVGLRPCQVCGKGGRLMVAQFESINAVRGRLKQCSFASFKPQSGTEKALAASQDFFRKVRDGGSPWLTIWGKSGNGKTHLGAAVVNNLHMAGLPAIMVDFTRFLGRLKQAFDNPDENAAEVLERFAHVPALVLDDLGAEYHANGFGTSWPDEQAFTLLDIRSELGLPTMILSNVNPAIMPMRVSSRLSEGIIINNTGEDMRPKLKGLT